MLEAMDKTFADALVDYRKFVSNHLYAKPGTSHFTLIHDSKIWDWKQFLDPIGFEWKTGITPLSDLATIRYAWAVYFALIMALKWFMKDREPFKIRFLTTIHNLILFLGSLAMFIGGVVGITQAYKQGGWGNVFLMDQTNQKGIMFYSLYIFYVSKFYELLDTVILVLKKKNIIFLHWYHHSIVILMVWAWLAGNHSFAVSGLVFNTFVHIFMYWYYFASNLGWNVWFKKYITTIQIIQFIGSFLVMIPFFYYSQTRPCNSFIVIYFSMAVNFSFLLLFIRFYIQNYKTAVKHKAKVIKQQISQTPETPKSNRKSTTGSVKNGSTKSPATPVRRSGRLNKQ